MPKQCKVGAGGSLLGPHFSAVYKHHPGLEDVGVQIDHTYGQRRMQGRLPYGAIGHLIECIFSRVGFECFTSLSLSR